jgi:hypothetical protein
MYKTTNLDIDFNKNIEENNILHSKVNDEQKDCRSKEIIKRARQMGRVLHVSEAFVMYNKKDT